MQFAQKANNFYDRKVPDWGQSYAKDILKL